ncbi:hypothetical protein NSQ14_01135 [Caldifermentibacillus hisashii]|uniref:hypothetical protein n=1 Tax=Caldifermentibacillus hisashii TaxID=996558 RepID=UPI0031FD62C7
MNIFIFFIYILFIYYIGFKGYKRIKSAEDLIVAGWSMPLPVVTGSLVAALLAAPFFFAAVGSGYTSGGFEGTATMAGLGTCMVLGALIWTKPLRRLKGWTIADYYGIRFGSKKLGAYTGTVMATAFGFFNAGALTVGGTYIIQSLCQNKKYTLERGSGKLIISFFAFSSRFLNLIKIKWLFFSKKGHTYPAFTKWVFFTALCGKETLHLTYSHIHL